MRGMRKFASLFLAVILFVGSLPVLAQNEVDHSYANRLTALDVIVEAIGQELPEDFHVLEAYTDTDDLQETSKQVLAFAVENEIIQGYGDRTLRPYGYLTRAEFAQMLYNASPFFSDKPKLVEFHSGYTDLLDWAYEAIVYCMERGLMVGYGNGLFGSLDYLTENQVALMADRLKYGLATYDKYNLLDANGQSPLIMPLVWQSGREPGFVPMDDPEDYRTMVETTPQEQAAYLKRFRDYIEITKTVNYHLLQDPEKLNEQNVRLWRLRGGNTYNDIFKNQLEKALAQKVYRESFFVSDESNSAKLVSGSLIDGSRLCMINGYEYFIYHEADAQALPEGVVLGKWYRRKVQLEYQFPSGISHSAFFFEEYSDPEPVPAELLNEGVQ